MSFVNRTKNLSVYLTTLLLLCVLPLIFSNCAGVKNISVLEHSVPGQNPTTKDKLTIYVTPIDQKNRLDFPDLVFKPESGKHLFYSRLDVFAYTPTAFKLEIVNQTGHIIRFQNSVISLIDLKNKTYAPVTRDELVGLWNEYKEPKGVAIANQVTLIDEKTVVLPGRTLEGYVAFAVDFRGIKKCTFTIYDLVTETDEAGNPIKRSNFEFQFDEKLVPAK